MPTDVLPAGWTVGWSAEHCHWYYFNSALGVTQWEPPKSLSLVAACYENDGNVENEERQMPVDHASASLALALALQEQEYQQARHGTGAASRAATNHATSGASRAAARRVEAAELRRHLYDGTPSETPAPPPCTPKGLSYAKAASALGEARPELARSAPAPTMQPAMAVQSRPRARRPTCGVSAEIRLLLDGANVAFRFGEANGRGGIFEWRASVGYCQRVVALAAAELAAWRSPWSTLAPLPIPPYPAMYHPMRPPLARSACGVG